MEDTLGAWEVLAGLLLATSVATERLVTIVKTLLPWLAREKTTPEGVVNLEADKVRRLLVQTLAVVASYATVAILFDTFNPFAKIAIGGISYYLGVVAVLGSGGSAFWTGVVGYLKEVKDARSVDNGAGRLAYYDRLSGRTTAVADGGKARYSLDTWPPKPER